MNTNTNTNTNMNMNTNTTAKLVAEDKGSAKGFLSVYRKYADGHVEPVFEDDPNVITKASKKHHLSFLTDRNAVPDILSSFKVGTGGTIDAGGLRPIKPDPSRNNLYAPITVNHSDIVIVPSPDTSDSVYLTVTFSLNQDEGNEKGINEVALFKESGDMFNIKTFRSVPKSESFSLVFEWKIIYV